MNTLLRYAFFFCLPIAAHTQTTSFVFNTEDNKFCSPVNVSFIQNSSGSPVGYLWNFGDGGYSNSANPKHIYTSAGTYTVKLVTVYANNTAEASRNVTINPSLNISFTADKENICQLGIVNFTASPSGNISNYQWDFGDSAQLVNTTTNTVSHNFTGYGEFTVTLTCTSSTACEAGFTRIIKIIEPEINGSVNNTNGCIPVSATFNADVNISNGSPVSNYLWNFGDGNISNTTSNTASHNYTATGTFLPTLKITTADGCISNFAFDTVAYGITPSNSIAYAPVTTFCASETPLFIAKATNANSYAWDFGGGSPVIATDTVIGHRFTQLGMRNITVTPMFNSCAGSPVSFSITVIGVVAQYSYKNTCNDKKTFTIRNTSEGNMSSIMWNHGDGTTSAVSGNFTHTYPQTGAFPLRLFIQDNATGCVDSFTHKIYTANPTLNDPDQSICINTNTIFTIQNNYTNPSAEYFWNVVGMDSGPQAEAELTINANILGHFNNNAVIINNGTQYCPDTIPLDHSITVRGPQLDFEALSSLCLNVPLTVNNLSHPFQPGDTVKSWEWYFGKLGAYDSVYQPLPYLYTVAKIYNVKLTAIDIYGCRDTLVKKVTVRPMPFIWIIPKTVTVCAGQSATLTGYTSDQISWTPVSGGICTNCDTTSVSPLVNTTYIATATNSFNCVSTDSSVVKVFAPFTATALTPDTAFCEGGKLQLDVEPRMKKIVWSSAETLSGNSVYNPLASPKNTTIYTATLTDSAGCFTSSADIKVTINPKPAVNAGADKIFSPNSAFNLTPMYSSNVRSWNWSPADSLSCSDCPSPKGIANQSTLYTLRVTSDKGCVAEDKINISVECNGSNLFLPTAFTPNNDRLNDLFRPIAKGIKSIKSFTIYNRSGQVIYQAKDFYPSQESSSGWDGKFRGQDQSSTTYLYIVEAVCDMGQTFISKGSFVLLR